MKQVPIYIIMLVLMAAIAAAGPVLSDLQDLQVNEGENVSLDVTLDADPDNGTMTNFSLNGSQNKTLGPHFVSITNTSNTTARLDFESGLVNANESYDILVNASDNNSTDSEMIQVNVTDAPRGPVMPAISDKNVDEGDQLSFTVDLEQGPDNGTTSWDLDNSSLGALSDTNDTHARFSMNASFVTADTQYTQTIIAEDDDSAENASFLITVVNTGNGVSISDISFGGDSQPRSNTQLDDDDSEYEINITSTFTVTNNEGVKRDIEVSWDTPSRYKVTYEDTNPVKSVTEGDDNITVADVGADETVDVTLRARVPEDQDCFFGDIDKYDEQREENIGTLTARAQNDTETSDMYMEAENELTIDDLEISVDGDGDDYSDGDEVEEISPGAEIEVELTAKNRFSSSDDLDMEDVEFGIYADDYDLDFEEVTDISDIDTRDEETATLSYTLDDDIDEDTYDVFVTLMGEDENGAMHGVQYELEFEITREDELIEVKRATLTRAEVSLCDFDSRRAELDVEIENEGEDDSDEVALQVKNEQLDLDERRVNLDLDSQDDYEETFQINVPEDTKPGTYAIQVLTFFDVDDYDDDEVNERKIVKLDVAECTDDEQSTGDGSDDQDSSTNESEEDVVVVTPPPQDEKNQTSGEVVAEPVEETQEGETLDFLYLGLLGLGYLVVIILILALLIRLFSKR